MDVFGLTNDLLDRTPKAQTTKTKIDKWAFIELKTTKWNSNLAGGL